MEHHRNIVRDGSSMVGHAQCIITVDQYAIPLDIVNGLPHMKMDRLPLLPLLLPFCQAGQSIDHRDRQAFL